ncbi:hypothetical protein [Calidithermus timidus]|uniref:hypothetical protein n=1 Tax=Calidithermus timidus TaxID=307124 RepID=UPI0003665620|nr:hypothetical protein [Calidithermus timidus]
MPKRLRHKDLLEILPTRGEEGLPPEVRARLERLRRLGIEGPEALVLAGLLGREFRSASQGSRNFQPPTPEELAMYED